MMEMDDTGWELTTVLFAGCMERQGRVALTPGVAYPSMALDNKRGDVHLLAARSNLEAGLRPADCTVRW